jgi:hypothetical protein
MPLASSVNKVIAGVQDILRALQHPSSGSPLAPLTDSKAAALRSLSNICGGCQLPSKPSKSECLQLPANLSQPHQHTSEGGGQ